jgi:predicted negative regulator of RcsB-dependent stress response
VRTSQRHQLKQDRFAETTKETISWAVENRDALIWTVGSVVVAAAIVLGATWCWDYRSERANTALGKAMETYTAQLRAPGAAANPDVVSFESAEQRSRAAEAQFQDVARHYGHTKPGRIARFMAAVTEADLGNTQAAEQELKRVADSSSANLSSEAKMVLAGLYLNANRGPEAVALYRNLIEHPTDMVTKTTAELALGAAYEAMNQRGEATQIYADIIKTSQKTPAANVAQQRLASLKQ